MRVKMLLFFFGFGTLVMDGSKSVDISSADEGESSGMVEGTMAGDDAGEVERGDLEPSRRCEILWVSAAMAEVRSAP